MVCVVVSGVGLPLGGVDLSNLAFKVTFMLVGVDEFGDWRFSSL